MSERIAEFGSDVEVVVVTFTTPAHLSRYIDTNRVSVTMLIDHDRAAYRAYGLGRASVTRIWGLRTLRRYVQIARQTGLANLRPATEDTQQLGGDFVIDGNGDLRYARWSAGPEDRPAIDGLIAAVRSTATDW